MGLTQVPKRGTGLGLRGTFPTAFEEASQHEPYNCKEMSSASSLRKHGRGSIPHQASVRAQPSSPSLQPCLMLNRGAAQPCLDSCPTAGR